MWDEASIRQLLTQVSQGKRTVEQACEQLRSLPIEDLDYARLDHHRAIRQGFAEVVYCAGKTPPQAKEIFARLAQKHPRVLATRASREHFDAIVSLTADAQYHEAARVVWLDRDPTEKLPGVVVVAAGTADLPVAEEACLTMEMMGHSAERIFDVGVAGLHRLLAELPALQKARVIVAVAGMEGALPSVVGGLVRCPVIAVPTSVGYGTGAGGLAALLSMLNSCAPGLAVVNIDNGFGAGVLAARINAMTDQSKESQSKK